MTSYTHIHLLDVEDAAPANGFGERWEARVARTAVLVPGAALLVFGLCASPIVRAGSLDVVLDGKVAKTVAINASNLFSFDNKLVLTGENIIGCIAAFAKACDGGVQH